MGLPSGVSILILIISYQLNSISNDMPHGRDYSHSMWLGIIRTMLWKLKILSSCRVILISALSSFVGENMRVGGNALWGIERMCKRPVISAFYVRLSLRHSFRMQKCKQSPRRQLIIRIVAHKISQLFCVGGFRESSWITIQWEEKQN